MARDKTGQTPLHDVASYGTPEGTQILLEAGAYANDRNEVGQTPWDLAQEHKNLKGTKGYWALNDAQYN